MTSFFFVSFILFTASLCFCFPLSGAWFMAGLYIDSEVRWQFGGTAARRGFRRPKYYGEAEKRESRWSFFFLLSLACEREGGNLLGFANVCCINFSGQNYGRKEILLAAYGLGLVT
ncbi:hypothetical protein GGI42DRAFT_302610 [Trichoderma sp. SZMC 28013]